jgi:protein-disulfide isomerase
VRIVAFEDFSCPHCKSFTTQVHPLLLAEFIETGKASLEFRHMVVLGPESQRAAEAAECAADQDAFWELHDLLFQSQRSPNTGVFTEGTLKEMARIVRKHKPALDVERFDRCLESGAKRSVVEAMVQEGRRLGVSSTPSFLVNGQLLVGSQPIDVFRRMIN